MGGIVFLGTSHFAVPSLRWLAARGETISLVLTQPDRPRGRSRRPEPSPVKVVAETLALPVLQPESVNSADIVEAVRSIAPEFIAVVAYGQILRRPILEIPSRGPVNLHASLLPRHRGPSPIAWTILEGDPEAGNTTMLMEEGLDSGPLLFQEALPLSRDSVRGDLEEILSERGAELLLETLAALRQGRVAPRPQDESRASWSHLLTREMRAVDWRRPAEQVRRRIHALSPTPGAVVRLEGKLLKILRVAEVAARGPWGRVLGAEPQGPVVGCGDGALLLREVQPEGRRPMSGADFVRGGGIRIGAALELAWDE